MRMGPLCSLVPAGRHAVRRRPQPLPGRATGATAAVGMLVAITLPAFSGCGAKQITADLAYFPPPPAEPHAVHIKSFNQLHELVPSRPSLLEVLRGGSISPFVDTPAGIAYRNGHLYVCDTGTNAVHDWDLRTGKAKQIGTQGETVLAKPVAVAVDEAGAVYVADTGLANVVVFDAAGREIRRLRPPPRDTFKPTAVAIHGGKLYVADIATHQIDVFSIDDGRHLTSFGRVGSGPGEFYFPMGLCTDARGRLFLSDMMNARVQVFDAAHHPVLSMGRPGNRYGDMGKPRHLAVGPDGVVFVADAEFAHVHLFNDRGQLLMLIGGREDEPGGTPMPVGVAVATELPDNVTALVPVDFRASYYLFVTNTIGRHRINLFAVGTAGE
jgi:DNA-binding beta-propeller fold protein YncE